MSRKCSSSVTLTMYNNYIERSLHSEVIMEKPSKKNQMNMGTNFLITVYHQENFTYQGVIEWLDTGKKMHFRSELELINLIHNAVALNTEKSDKLRTWQDERMINVI